MEDPNQPLLPRLQRLVADCERDDSRATSAPWIWTDDRFLTLKEAARRVEFLENLAIQGNVARDRLRDRILQLERALHLALSLYEPLNLAPEHSEELSALRGVLDGKNS